MLAVVDIVKFLMSVISLLTSLLTGIRGGNKGDTASSAHELATTDTFPSDTNFYLKNICRLLVSLDSLDPRTTTIRLRVTPGGEPGLAWPILPHELLGLSLAAPEFVSSMSSSASPSVYRRQVFLVKDAWYQRAAYLSQAEPQGGPDGHYLQLDDSAKPDLGQDSLLSLTSWSANVLMEPLVWLAYRDLVVTTLRKSSSLFSGSSSAAWRGELLQDEDARRERLRSLCRDFP